MLPSILKEKVPNNWPVSAGASHNYNLSGTVGVIPPTKFKGKLWSALSLAAVDE